MQKQCSGIEQKHPCTLPQVLGEHPVLARPRWTYHLSNCDGSLNVNNRRALALCRDNWTILLYWNAKDKPTAAPVAKIILEQRRSNVIFSRRSTLSTLLQVLGDHSVLARAQDGLTHLSGGGDILNVK